MLVIIILFQIINFSYNYYKQNISAECPVLVDFYWKLAQIVSEIECIFACSDCYRNISRNHCEELCSNIADICKIATELVPYSIPDSYDLGATNSNDIETRIIMKKL